MGRQPSPAPARNEGSRVVRLESAEGAGGFDAQDGLEAFHSEADWSDSTSAPKHAAVSHAASLAAAAPRTSLSFPLRHEPRAPRAWITVLLLAIAVAEAPFVAMWLFQDDAAVSGARAGTVGTVFVESEPSGLEVLVNGTMTGNTPARLSLPRGAVELQLRHEGSTRVLPLMVNPDETLRLRVEFPAGEPGQSSALVPGTPTVSAAAPQSLARAGQAPLP
jgi:hypothetical protein